VRHKHGLSADLFDEVVELGPKSRDTLSAFANWSLSLLQVYHPTTPSAKALAQQLRDEDFESSLLEKGKDKNRYLLITLLDAADLSLAQGHYQDARDISRFAAQLIPMPWAPSEQLDDAEQVRQMRQEVLTNHGVGAFGLALT
jgi:hypothetical protein